MIIYGIKKAWFVGGMTSSLGTAQKHSITHSLKAQEGTKQSLELRASFLHDNVECKF